MKDTIKIILLATLISIITACSSEDEEGFKNLPGELAEPADIIGVWDGSSGDENGYDEFYTVVRDNGTFTDFDYQGDTQDNGNDCYERADGSYRYEGDGIYVFNFNGDSKDYRVKITKEQSLLYLAYSDGEDESWFNLTGQFTEADATPLCN
jgi:hypothetical protein